MTDQSSCNTGFKELFREYAGLNLTLDPFGMTPLNSGTGSKKVMGTVEIEVLF